MSTKTRPAHTSGESTQSGPRCNRYARRFASDSLIGLVIAAFIVACYVAASFLINHPAIAAVFVAAVVLGLLAAFREEGH